MGAVETGAILKIVAQYGVLGLGWIAWILTMFYLQLERKRYAALVTHIISHFTKVNLAEINHEESEELTDADTRHKKTFRKLFP